MLTIYFSKSNRANPSLNSHANRVKEKANTGLAARNINVQNGDTRTRWLWIQNVPIVRVTAGQPPLYTRNPRIRLARTINPWLCPLRGPGTAGGKNYYSTANSYLTQCPRIMRANYMVIFPTQTGRSQTA